MKKNHEQNRNPEGVNQYTEVSGQSDHRPQESAKVAKEIGEEHGVGEKTVRRSADLYKAHEIRQR